MKILDIGCGKKKIKTRNKKDRIIGLDLVKTSDADIVWDLEKLPWPLKDNEFDLVIATHILEHLSNIVGSMEEIWRILKRGGKLRVVVLYHSSPGANTDPTHKINFAYRSLNYFLKIDYNFDFYTKNKFELVSRRLIFHRSLKFLERFFNRFPYFYERFFRYLLPAEELRFELKK